MPLQTAPRTPAWRDCPPKGAIAATYRDRPSPRGDARAVFPWSGCVSNSCRSVPTCPIDSFHSAGSRGCRQTERPRWHGGRKRGHAGSAAPALAPDAITSHPSVGAGCAGCVGCAGISLLLFPQPAKVEPMNKAAAPSSACRRVINCSDMVRISTENPVESTDWPSMTDWHPVHQSLPALFALKCVPDFRIGRPPRMRGRCPVRTRLCAVGVLVVLVFWASPLSAQMLGMPAPPQDRIGPQPLSELPPPPLPGPPERILPPQPTWPPSEPTTPAVAPVWPLAPPPGWFLSLDAAFLRPSVWADDFTDDYGPLNPQLRRTFAPTGTIGYRFNNGAAVLLAYRYLAASATTVFPPSPPPFGGGEGPPPYPPAGPVQTRFASNWLDLDYRSPYLGGWHNFRFQWQAGLRSARAVLPGIPGRLQLPVRRRRAACRGRVVVVAWSQRPGAVCPRRPGCDRRADDGPAVVWRCRRDSRHLGLARRSGDALRRADAALAVLLRRLSGRIVRLGTHSAQLHADRAVRASRSHSEAMAPGFRMASPRFPKRLRTFPNRPMMKESFAWP